MPLLVRYIPLILLSVLLGVLIWRRAYKLCPSFFIYAAFGVAADLTRLGVRLSTPHNSAAYYATYWSTEGGYALLGIAVMYETFRNALRPLKHRKLVHIIFPLILISSFTLAFFRSNSNTTHVNGIPSYIVMGEMAVRFVEVLVFGSLVTLVPLLGLRWRQYPFGVATGFGLYSTVMLLTTTKLSDFGTRFKLLWSVTSLVAYSLAVLIWIWFFSVPQKVENSSELSTPSPGDLKKYKDALRRMR
jgi:hypothetical protein